MSKPAALTLVFWDVVDFPLPTGYGLDSLTGNIESALQSHNYRSRVSIMAYGGCISDELVESYMSVGILYWGDEEKHRRLSMLLLEILNAVYSFKLDLSLGKPHVIFILKDIPQLFAPVLEKLKLLHSTLEIHLVVPHDCVPERHVLYHTSKLVWAWEALLRGRGAMADSDFPPLARTLGRRVAGSVRREALRHGSGSVRRETSEVFTSPPCLKGVPNIKDSMSSSEHAAISVFWNVDDFPIPSGHNLQSFCRIIKSALEKEGYHGDLSITAYGAEDNLGGGITFVPESDKYWRLHRMLFDMSLSTLEKFDPVSSGKYLMLLTKNVSRGLDLVNLLECMTSCYNYIVLLVVPRDCKPEKEPLPKVNKVWFWESLIDGGRAITQRDLKILLARCQRPQFNYLLR